MYFSWLFPSFGVVSIAVLAAPFLSHNINNACKNQTLYLSLSYITNIRIIFGTAKKIAKYFNKISMFYSIKYNVIIH